MPGPYIACPECGGASNDPHPETGEQMGDECPRCGHNGSVAESEATPDEIERHRRFWEENDRWANKVDLRD